MGPIVFLMGVSGSGKSTIASILSDETGIPYFDADDFHSFANKEKMHKGTPLNDDDRAGWLDALNELARKQALKNGAIIACSALKEKYRQVLADGIQTKTDWVLLKGNFDLISSRLAERKGHFMPETLLRSQFETLETPANALVMDISESPADIVKKIKEHLQL